MVVYAAADHEEVLSVFSTREKAERYINLMDTGLWVEEIELDPPEPEVVYSRISYDVKKERVLGIESELKKPTFYRYPSRIGDYFKFIAEIKGQAIQEVMQLGVNSQKILECAQKAYEKYRKKEAE